MVDLIQNSHHAAAQRAAALMTLDELLRERERILGELDRINIALSSQLEQPCAKRFEDADG